MPARVAFMTPGALRTPPATQAAMARLGDAVAVAHLHRGRHLVDGDLLAGSAEIEQQRQPLVGQRRVAVEALHEIGGLADIAHQDAADQAALAHDQLLVGALLRLGELDDLVAVLGGLGDAHGGELHAHDLELGRELGAVIGGVDAGR